MQLEGKRIIVTGAAQGIGAAVVRAYVGEGATVVALDRQVELGREATAQAAQNGPGSATFQPCDITDRDQVDSAFGAAARSMGGLDVMVNVAGVHKHMPPEEVTDEFYDFIFQINVLGTMLTNRAAFNLMRNAGTGNIINFGSESGLTGELHNAVYGASKGAVHTWTRTVAREWGPSGIRVNAVLPYVTTPMYEQFRAALSAEELAAHDEATKKDIPLGGKFGDPDQDLGPVMVFLASDASHFVTGQMLPVDGGLISVR